MNEKLIKKKEEEQLVFFNDALEYYENEFPTTDHQNNTFSNNAVVLRDQMLFELSNLKEIIINNPDIKYESLTKREKEIFKEFIDFYSRCPICKGFNHFYNLREFYFDDLKHEVRESLIDFMNSEEKLNVDIGIPCCNCFKNHFED